MQMTTDLGAVGAGRLLLQLVNDFDDRRIKYANHLSLYWRIRSFARPSRNLNQSNRKFWVDTTSAELEPVLDDLLAILKGKDKLSADETRPEQSS